MVDTHILQNNNFNQKNANETDKKDNHNGTAETVLQQII